MLLQAFVGTHTDVKGNFRTFLEQSGQSSHNDINFVFVFIIFQDDTFLVFVKKFVQL